jgi:hypothetical protein
MNEEGEEKRRGSEVEKTAMDMSCGRVEERQVGKRK